jgi:copper(I)-binding protein
MDRRLLLQIAAAVGLTLASILAIAVASRADAQKIEVRDAFARATIGASMNGVVYLTVENRAAVPDRLLGATTPAAERAELHEHRRDGNVLRMRRLDAVEVAPHAAVEFRPGGTHVMLLGLKTPLKEGESFPLSLEFETAGRITIEVPVKSIAAGAIGPAAHDAHGAGQAE